MTKYFPDTYPKGRQCDRDYLFNVANTLHEGVVQELIDYALKQRYDPALGANQCESILISDKWKEELQSLPLTHRVSISIFLPRTNIFSLSHRKKERW